MNNNIKKYINMLNTNQTEYITCRIVFDMFDLTDGIPIETRANYFQSKLDALEGPTYLSKLVSKLLFLVNYPLVHPMLLYDHHRHKWKQSQRH